MRFANWGLATCITAAVSCLSPNLHADTRTFQKIVDTNTPIPGGTGNFATLTHAEVHQGNVVFAGNGAGSGPANQRGIYRFNPATSGLSTIIDQNTALPGTPQSKLLETLANGSFAIFGPDVAFSATGPSSTRILSTRGGLHVVADANPQADFGYGRPLSMSDQIYAGSVNLQRSGTPNLQVSSFARITEAGQITNGPNLENVFKYLARGSSVPHTTRSRFVGTPYQHILNSSVGTFVFAFGADPSNFSVPGETSSPVSPGSTTGTNFSDDGASVVFRADTNTRTTLVSKVAGGNLRVVVDTNTVIPTFDGTSAFNSFTDVAIDNGVIAFIGAPATGPAGIFTETNGALAELVSAGDTLDGKTITTLDFSGDRPLSEHSLAFTATFSDGSTGLYLASVPEPTALALIPCAAVPLLVRRRTP